MPNRIGIRREDKNEWERRSPLIPGDVGLLKRESGIDFSLQPSGIRAFRDAEYLAVGAQIDEQLSGCSVILGIKEMPADFFIRGNTYVFFAHVIKGQPYNMPMLKRLMEIECNLIDYERITDDDGRRLVFFGNEAGQAGMIDTLWALGQKVRAEGTENPFTGLRKAVEYSRLTAIEPVLETMSDDIARNGVPPEIHPVVFGFAGYGNVSIGAQGILDHLPVLEISPRELLDPPSGLMDSPNRVYKVVFKEEHMVEPVDSSHPFELQDYYDHPEHYRGVFPKYVPHLTVLMNCIYWSEKYPRLVTKEQVKKLYSDERPKLRVIGDISCDIEGAIEVTTKVTDSGNPVFVYDVDTGEAVDGVEGNGPVILAVDNLPAELPRESSSRFSSTLRPFIPKLAIANFSLDFDDINLPDSIRKAMICYHGELTPDYEYLHEFIDRES